MRISLIAALVIGFLAREAAAQPDKVAAQAAFTDGQQRYAAGDYLPAAMKFEAAYAADPDPVYLFNVAQAYRLGNACPKAVAYYKRFLAAVPNPPNLAKVNQYLEQSEACVKAMAVADPVTKPTPPVDPIVTDPPNRDQPTSADPGRTKRWVGIGAIFLGGAAVGVGVYYTTEASRLTDERQDLRAMCLEVPCDAGYGKRLDDQGERAELRAKLSYALGGVAVIGGIVLYVLGRSSEQSTVAVVPTADGGALAVGAFTF